VELRTLAGGSNATAKPSAPQAVAAQEDATYQRLWSSMIGGGSPPPVDFQSESAVFLLAGSKPTGGWTVVARGASVKGKTLVVDAAIKPPPPDAYVTQAFTSPYAVVAVSTKAFEDVRWTP